jgi:hypothetical protein
MPLTPLTRAAMWEPPHHWLRVTTVVAPVPHRQVVLAVPKRLRP